MNKLAEKIKIRSVLTVLLRDVQIYNTIYVWFEPPGFPVLHIPQVSILPGSMSDLSWQVTLNVNSPCTQPIGESRLGGTWPPRWRRVHLWRNTGLLNDDSEKKKTHSNVPPQWIGLTYFCSKVCPSLIGCGSSKGEKEPSKSPKPHAFLWQEPKGLYPVWIKKLCAWFFSVDIIDVNCFHRNGWKGLSLKWQLDLTAK